MRKTLFGLGAAIFTLANTFPILAGTWQTTDNMNWKYLKDNGTYAAASWEWIDSNADGIAECYHFDANGMMDKASVVEGYTLAPEGQWHIDGVIQTKRTAELNSGWYMNCGFWRFSSNGIDEAGKFKKINNLMYYFDEKGNMLTGFQQIDGSLYHFDESGAMNQKTFKLDGVYYVIEAKDGVISDEVDSDDWGTYKKETGYKPSSITNYDVKKADGSVDISGGSDSTTGATDVQPESSKGNTVGNESASGRDSSDTSEDSEAAAEKPKKSGPAGDMDLKELSSDRNQKPVYEEQEKQAPPDGYGQDRIPQEILELMKKGLLEVEEN